MKRLIALITLAGLAATAAAEIQTVKCPATRDVGLSAVRRERNGNTGAADRFKLKVWQEFALVDFDVSALKGKRISSARIYLKHTGGAVLGLNGGSDLRWLVVSTVSHDWVEGKSTRLGETPKAGGATFNESSFGKQGWGWPGAKVYDVSLGSGNTLRSQTSLGSVEGYLRADLDVRMVQALVAGASHGLLLMDGSTSVGQNSRVRSREGRDGPFLVVTVAGDDNRAPRAPRELQITPAGDMATAKFGALAVSLKVPDGAMAFNVKVSGREVARWQVPFAGDSGATQTFNIIDLPPGKRVRVEVAAVDAAGNVSPYVSASGATSAKLSVPALPAPRFTPRAGLGPMLGRARVWAFPEITKVDPVSGRVLHEKGLRKIRASNSVWSGATRTIRLAAARGEIISFQVAVEGKISNCKLEVSDLTGPGRAVISRNGVKLWRNWYVQNNAEYALPLEGTFSCPQPDNKIARQKLQAVTVDYHIPTAARAGDYKGTVTLSSGGARVKLTLKVKVYDVVIPDEIHFNPELNCYSGPGQAGSPQFNDSFKLAHYHRATINRVPYNQTGIVDKDWSPDVDKQGRVTRWSRFDKGMAPLLDGSLFADNPRKGVPVATFYLPLFEGWPRNFLDHYNPGPGVPVSVKDPADKLRHDILAKPIEQSLDRKFQEAFVNCTRDFVDHARAKGWNRTIFECYLNNKPNYGYTVWTLDEPVEYLDWAAINFFGRLWKKAIDDPSVYDAKWHRRLYEEGLAAMNRSRPTFLFRGDISRPQWQGSVSDGLINVMYVNNSGLNMPRLLRNAKTRMPTVLYLYGSCNKVNSSNWQSAAWCLKAFTANADGVLPWSSLGGAGSLRKANTNGLIINAGPLGRAVASFRLHALRRGAQDCELLRLLQLKKGWTREHIGMLVAQKIPMTAGFRQAFSDEAAAVTFGTLTARGFAEMKEGVLQLLTEPDK